MTETERMLNLGGSDFGVGGCKLKNRNRFSKPNFEPEPSSSLALLKIHRLAFDRSPDVLEARRSLVAIPAATAQERDLEVVSQVNVDVWAIEECYRISRYRHLGDCGVMVPRSCAALRIRDAQAQFLV